jgi:hypothetical protein
MLRRGHDVPVSEYPGRIRVEPEGAIQLGDTRVIPLGSSFLQQGWPADMWAQMDLGMQGLMPGCPFSLRGVS